MERSSAGAISLYFETSRFCGIYISRDYYNGCMLTRNHRLVEAAGLLLAVYNKVPRSGTGATINYARKIGRDIILIDPVTRLVTHENPTSNLKQGGRRI